MFFKHFKYPLFLIAFITLVSCSEFQQILRDTDVDAKYKLAEDLYKEGKYKKALQVMEQIVPLYRGRPEARELMYMYANTFYNLKDYYLAAYQFERFETSYPNSDSVQEAAFKAAKSYYQVSPRFSLDQKDTKEAMQKLQNFVNKYPESTQLQEANALVNELKEKLEEKDIEVAHQYLKTAEYLGSFKPAIKAYENFILNHPGSKYREDAFFGKFKAAYLRAIKSIPSQVSIRLEEALEHYKGYIKYYPEANQKEEVDKILSDIETRMNAQATTKP